MKLSLADTRALSLALLLALTHTARAEECTVRLSNALVQVGRIMPAAAGAATTLTPRTVNVMASCAQPARLLLVLQGASLGEHFKFADHAQLSLRLSNALLDGQAVELAPTSPAGEQTQASSSSLLVKPGDSLTPTRNGQAVSGTHLSVQMEISAQVGAEEFHVRDSKTLEAMISLSVRAY